MKTIEFAIKMELDGEKYYLEQKAKTENVALQGVFELLAQEERHHAELLEKYAAKADYELKQSTVPDSLQNVFTNAKDLDVEYKVEPEHLDAYQLALEKEKESIELYEKLGSEASGEKEKKLFAFLVEQEKIHYDTFAQLIEHVRKAEQWVEDAEFGIRPEEY